MSAGFSRGRVRRVEACKGVCAGRLAPAPVATVNRSTALILVRRTLSLVVPFAADSGRRRGPGAERGSAVTGRGRRGRVRATARARPSPCCRPGTGASQGCPAARPARRRGGSGRAAAGPAVAGMAATVVSVRTSGAGSAPWVARNEDDPAVNKRRSDPRQPAGTRATHTTASRRVCASAPTEPKRDAYPSALPPVLARWRWPVGRVAAGGGRRRLRIVGHGVGRGDGGLDARPLGARRRLRLRRALWRCRR